MNYLELASHSSFFDFWRVHKMSLVSNFAWTATNQRLVLFCVNQSEASITWPVTRLPLLTTLYPIFSKPLRTFENQMVSPEQGEFKKDTFFSRKYFFLIKWWLPMKAIFILVSPWCWNNQVEEIPISEGKVNFSFEILCKELLEMVDRSRRGRVGWL